MKTKSPVASVRISTNQCQKPSGWLGQLIVWNLNSRHSKVTDWGLSHITVKPQDTILDVGCGGGKTVSKMAAIATQGKVFGLDYSDVSVAVAKKLNARWIQMGRVEIQEGSVSALPFAADTFDLITAIETHFWWPDLPGGMREILRVLKPGGTLAIIAEIYRGAATKTAQLAEKYISRSGMKFLSVDEHRALFADAGYSDSRIVTESGKSWICGIGKKPST